MTLMLAAFAALLLIPADAGRAAHEPFGALDDPMLYPCNLNRFSSEPGAYPPGTPTPPLDGGGYDFGPEPEPVMMTHYECLEEHFKQWWVPSFMDMTVQLTATAMHQLFVLGQMLDAKTQLETQLLLDRMKAEAHRDYHPDTGMCRIGTNVRSLSASENRTATNTRILYTTMVHRNMMASDVVSSGGPRNDYRSRIKQFQEKYCHAADNNGYLKNDPPNNLTDALCGEGNQPKNRINRDIDYTRLIENSYTLDIDLTDTGPPTPDEEDALSLSRNLLNHKSFKDVPHKHLKHEYSKDGYQDMRSLFALRSVADNSLAHIIGMRAKGAPEVSVFLGKMVEELGVPEEEIALFLGENPSYYAQMEVLTSIMYENPNFYSNLYTKPMNVERLGLALEGIKLMQDRDRYEAALRREMIISTILEMKLRDLQSRVGDRTLQGLTVVFPGGPGGP